MIKDYPLLLFALSFFAMTLSAWIGASISKRRRILTSEEREDLGIIQAATLTLLGLIIAFTFSMALNRYSQRKNYEEAEANSIGTEYLRLGLLPSTDVARGRALLLNYLDQRILFYTANDERQLRQINAQTANLQTELWSSVQASAVAATDTCRRRGGRGHERRVELTRLCPGCVVEPNPGRGMGPDVGDRHLRQRADRL